MTKFDHVDVSDMKAEEITQELIDDLMGLVGVDAISEFGELLVDKRADLVPVYIEAIKTYYKNQDQTLIDTISEDVWNHDSSNDNVNVTDYEDE